VEDTLGMIGRGGSRLLIFFSPLSSRLQIVACLRERHSILPEEGEDLGMRMQNASQTSFTRGCVAAVLIGGDYPDLPGWIIEEGLAAASISCRSGKPWTPSRTFGRWL
jgi:glycosyltransferase A (GT-A) superfamily protein (DUF2064 family)